MADIGPPLRVGWWQRLSSRLDTWMTDCLTSEAFQDWAARNPLTRTFVRRDAAKIYDLVAGFVYSQTLLAVVELDILQALRRGPMSVQALAVRASLQPDRMRALCQAASAIGLLKLRRDGSYGLARHGAAVLGVPGLSDMIRHHRIFYRDLDDPVALLRSDKTTELSRFWPYVAGNDRDLDETTARTYSDLMATSQALVAEETLNAVSLGGFRRLADIGGGTGVFLEHIARRHDGPDLVLFDLPPVALAGAERLRSVGLQDRIIIKGGSFLGDPLPAGCDALSLVRVLYDHDDQTIRTLLSRVHDALEPGGTVIISEPMSGGDRPSRAGDAYFGFYTMAMTTGRPRSAATHAGFLQEAGFADIRTHQTRRPFLTGVVTARKRRVHGN